MVKQPATWKAIEQGITPSHPLLSRHNICPLWHHELSCAESSGKVKKGAERPGQQDTLAYAITAVPGVLEKGTAVLVLGDCFCVSSRHVRRPDTMIQHCHLQSSCLRTTQINLH